jgi:hypothetical protein
MSKEFLRGMSEAINLFPRERGGVRVLLPTYSNEDAFRKDLEQVGADMYSVIKKLAGKSKKSWSQDDLKNSSVQGTSASITKPILRNVK